jgi:hypothetical protein
MRKDQEVKVGLTVAIGTKRTIRPHPPLSAIGVTADIAAWRRFVTLIEALPPDQAAPLWREARAQAAEFLGC